MAEGLRQVAGLPDPVGEVVRGSTLANGLQLRQVRVPFGVVGIIYEARPNVTADAAGICVKSGNAVLLRGSSSALSSNTAIVATLRRAAAEGGLPEDVVQLVPGEGHESVKELMRARGLVDVLIPRGGAGLIRSVVEESTVPVIETGVGNCHVYVDSAADLDMAERIVLNAKTHRTSVCNAAESLLVHADVADEFVPRIVGALQDAGVLIHGDETFARPGGRGSRPLPRTGATEYLALEISAAVVPSLGCRDRAHPGALLGPLRRDRDRLPEPRPAVRRRRRLGSGAGQRLDPVHRRGRVRLRRGDRHLHAEAARARSDGTARDDLDQVRRHGARPRPVKLLLLTFGFGVVSAIIPIFNMEAYISVVYANTSRPLARC